MGVRFVRCSISSFNVGNVLFVGSVQKNIVGPPFIEFDHQGSFLFHLDQKLLKLHSKLKLSRPPAGPGNDARIPVGHIGKTPRKVRTPSSSLRCVDPSFAAVSSLRRQHRGTPNGAAVP